MVADERVEGAGRPAGQVQHRRADSDVAAGAETGVHGGEGGGTDLHLVMYTAQPGSPAAAALARLGVRVA
ncbi:hypothetical protein AB0K18_22055 [Nonomuraea sp. NPDC049421]|uniref:hypothetical protein n=1 Tax=Nonomuraea sp. NPDC049421 TaxID=3155275 RepID=UPI0034130D2C